MWRSKLDKTRRLGVAMFIANSVYLVWLFFHVRGVIGDLFFALEILVYIVSLLFLINHWSRRFILLGGQYSLRTPVDVFIPTVDEPLEMLEASMEAAAGIEHPSLHLYVLDDGARKEVRDLAQKYNFTYLSRTDRLQKRYKSANLNFGLRHATLPYQSWYRRNVY